MIIITKEEITKQFLDKEWVDPCSHEGYIKSTGEKMIQIVGSGSGAGFHFISLLSKAIAGNLTVEELMENACKYIPDAVNEWNEYIRTT